MYFHDNNFVVCSGTAFPEEWRSFCDQVSENIVGRMPYQVWHNINSYVKNNKGVFEDERSSVFVSVKHDKCALEVVWQDVTGDQNHRCLFSALFPIGSFDQYVLKAHDHSWEWAEYSINNFTPADDLMYDLCAVTKYTKLNAVKSQEEIGFDEVKCDKPLVSFDPSKEVAIAATGPVIDAKFWNLTVPYNNNFENVLISTDDFCKATNSYTVSADTLVDAISQIEKSVQSFKDSLSNTLFEPTLAEVIQQIVDEVVDENNITITHEKENKTMKMFNLDFGPVSNSDVRLSMYGIAVKNANGAWVSYNKSSGEIIDVDILNFEGKNMIYKMPVALKDVAAGDCLIHNRKPMIVINVTGGVIAVVDVMAGERKEILPTKSPFGFDFYTKVVSLLDGANISASTDAPFGNMLPWMLMMNESGENDNLAMMMLFAQNGGMDMGNMMSNPMMVYALMSGNEDMKQMLPFLMMGAATAAPKIPCTGIEDPRSAVSATYYAVPCNEAVSSNWAPPSR